MPSVLCPSFTARGYPCEIHPNTGYQYQFKPVPTLPSPPSKYGSCGVLRFRCMCTCSWPSVHVQSEYDTCVLVLNMALQTSSGIRPVPPCPCGCAGILYKESGGRGRVLVTLSVCPVEKGGYVSEQVLAAFQASVPCFTLVYGDGPGSARYEFTPQWEPGQRMWMLQYTPTFVTCGGNLVHWKATNMGKQVATPRFEVRSKPSTWLAVFPLRKRDSMPSSTVVSARIGALVPRQDVYVLPSRHDAVLARMVSRTAFNRVMGAFAKPGDAFVIVPLPSLNKWWNRDASMPDLSLHRPLFVQGSTRIRMRRPKRSRPFEEDNAFIPVEAIDAGTCSPPVFNERAFDCLLEPVLSPVSLCPFPWPAEWDDTRLDLFAP